MNSNYLLLSRFHESSMSNMGVVTLLNSSHKVLFSCVSLELPFRNNNKNISSVPVGTYSVVANNTNNHPNTLRLPHIHGRSGILLHIGNYVRNSQGCILLGSEFTQLDNDGIFDVIGSASTFKALKPYLHSISHIIIK